VTTRDDAVRRALTAAPIPGSEAAAERARTVVLDAFERREPAPARHRRTGLRLALGIAGAALVAGVAVASTGGESIRQFVHDAVIAPKAKQLPATQMRLPGGGSLLVRAPDGAPSALWVVHADGTKTSLGRYRDGSWSPHARFVVATAGHRLVALDPHSAKVHWSIAASSDVRGARWSLEPTVPPCCRVAYLAAGARPAHGTLRIVAGDGSDDHALAPADPRVAPAWRPGSHERALAYVDPLGAVRLVAADSGHPLALPYHHGFRPTRLAWSSDGRRLLAMNPVRLVVLDASLHQVGAMRRVTGGDGQFTAAAFATRGHAVLLLRRLGHGSARVELLPPDRPARPLETLVGGLDGLSPSPDGRTVLVGWSQADQWLLLPTRPGGQGRRVTGLLKTFGSAVVPVASAWARGR
jgi:hypothetical protein